jgi:hypothetical protein
MSGTDTSVGSPLGRLLRRPLLHFALIGLALYTANGMLREPPDRPRIRIGVEEIAQLESGWLRQTGRALSTSQREWVINERIDEELLLQEAYSYGWHETDGIVQRRLLQNQRFLEPESTESDAVLLKRAYDQGMDRSDIVVRRRLLERMKLAIASRARSVEPDERVLEDHLAANAQRYERPERIRLSHVFLSADTRSDSIDQEAAALRDRLVAQSIAPEEAAGLGDPFLLSSELPLWSEDQLGRRMGAGFAEHAMRAIPGGWSDPIASSYGLHLVWPRDYTPAEPATLATVRAEVSAAVLREREAEALRAHLERLRAETRIEVDGTN